MKAAHRDRRLLESYFTGEQALQIRVITVSDRASAGVYEDKSGPLVADHLEDHFRGSALVWKVERRILSDDAAGLEAELRSARADGCHMVITTGGTGAGPRDNTPEVVLKLADKVIPGIMELVRMKYGADKPCALLSRTVAATMGSTIVYALPGSSKGVNEYMEELRQTMDHLLCVVHGLDTHE